MNKETISQTLPIILLITMALMVSPLQAQSCNSAAARTAPDSRYQDNRDGTVTDQQTGLMWMQCSIGQSGSNCEAGSASIFTWDLALQQAELLNSGGGFAGYNDWRLPNVHELESLTELACWSPAINITFFPNTPGSYYWSSSPSAYGSYYAWYVYFYGGFSSATTAATAMRCVWCVADSDFGFLNIKRSIVGWGEERTPT